MDSATVLRLAADALLVAHCLFVVFIVGGLAFILLGGWLGWPAARHRGFRFAHLACVGVVVAQAWAGAVCPLTTWEMALRERAGDATYSGSFIAHWLHTLLYYQAPAWVFTLAYTAFGALVLLSVWLVPPGPGGARRGGPG